MIITDEIIRELWTDKFPQYLTAEWAEQWFNGYVDLLDQVKNATRDELAAEEFMVKLWDHNVVSDPGQGTINVSQALKDPALREWFAGLRDRHFSTGEQRVSELDQLYFEGMEKIAPYCSKKPWLKLTRFFAAIFPHDFCCVVNHNFQSQLTKYLGVYQADKRHSPAWKNYHIYTKLGEALGPAGTTTMETAKRSIFTWFLFEYGRNESGTTVETTGQAIGSKPGSERLVFPPIAQRKKGLASLNGHVDTILRILDYARDGAKSSEIVDMLGKDFPAHKRSSLQTYVNVARSELGLMKLTAGDILVPNSVGMDYLENGDPDILQSILLTRIIGFDRILWELREKSTQTKKQLVATLMNYYPGWKSEWMPNTLLTWAKGFELVKDDNGIFSLTERGERWADLLEEKPEDIVLQSSSDNIVQPSKPEDGAAIPPVTSAGKFVQAGLIEILERAGSLPYLFTKEMLAEFHVALHAISEKHFVLLSGLSGTGKTLLAGTYARCYHGLEQNDDNPYFLLVPVKPDWTDPTGLLGYINPIGDVPTYVRTSCLEFLIRAWQDPSRAYFLCLDEMNLARVEYYFAPFLSAMETRSRLVIHDSDSVIDGVPPELPWPANLFIIGTVNIDETTYPFSNKVLDRAFTMEFWDVDLQSFGQKFLVGRPQYSAELAAKLLGIMGEIQETLPVRLHFGYRTAEEILLYVQANETAGLGLVPVEQALDNVVYMKLLPKIRGENSSLMQTALSGLGAVLIKYQCAKSVTRLDQMKEELRTAGITKFWR